jgi:flagellar biosynthesis protein FlhB
MPDHTADKSFDPTPHRRQEARRQGHVAKSHDLSSAGMALLGLAVLLMLGGGLVGFLLEYCRRQLGGEPWLAADAAFVGRHWVAVLWGLGRYLLPILGLLCLAGIVVNVLQIGFLFLPERLALDPARINPLAGLQRLFSLGNAARLGLAALKIASALAVAAFVIYGQRESILRLPTLPVQQLALQVPQILFWTALKIAAALFVLSLLDYGYQWWKREQDLKMTPQEMREELRNLEGNPQAIARRKQAQRKPYTNRPAAAASSADVVLTHPSGLAVAVVYDPDAMSAPTVLAKGSGTVGKRIQESADRRRVAVVENGTLAQSLYRHVAVGRPISAEHYAAVAKVLSEVYQRAERSFIAGSHPASPVSRPTPLSLG